MSVKGSGGEHWFGNLEGMAPLADGWTLKHGPYDLKEYRQRQSAQNGE